MRRSLVIALVVLFAVAVPADAQQTPSLQIRIRTATATVDTGSIEFSIRNRNGSPGETYPYTARVIPPNNAVTTAAGTISTADWSTLVYPRDFPGSPVLQVGTTRIEYLSGAGVVDADSITLAAAANAGCYGDEAMSFNPPNPISGQNVTINVTSARASTNIGMLGNPIASYLGAGQGGKGTYWSWSIPPLSPGTYGYTFTINGVSCASASVVVNPSGQPGNPQWQTSVPRALVPQSNGAVSIGLRNANGGGSFQIRVEVTLPNGAVYATTTNLSGDSWANVSYPNQFRGAPSLIGNPGRYTVSWAIVGGAYAAQDGFNVG